MKPVNPLHPARLALLWVLGGIPLERHTAAILRIDEAHQDRVARLRRQTYVPRTTITLPDVVASTARYDLTTYDITEGARWAAGKARRYPGARIALVAPTFTFGRDTMVETALLSVLESSELCGESTATAWNRSMGELSLANGSRFKIFSSERPERLRGPQHHFAWGHSPDSWPEAAPGGADTMSNLNIGLRLSRRPDWDAEYCPQGMFSGTLASSPA